MKNENAIPADMGGLIPHLVCRNATEAMAFYTEAFGAVELARLPAPDGRLMHAMMRIGGAVFMLNDEFPEHNCPGPQSIGGSPVTLHRYVDDVDAAFEQAVKAGARAIMPPADMFWGDRYGVLEDPAGHRWSLATHLRDMSPEEIAGAMHEACSDTAQGAA